MHDFTVVEFPKLGWSFNVPSILADFTIPGINLHLTIHWYGVIIAFGFLLAVLLGGRMAYKWKMSLIRWWMFDLWHLRRHHRRAAVLCDL